MLDSQSCNNMHQVCVMEKDQFTQRCISYPDIMILTFSPAKIIYFTNWVLFVFFFFFVKEIFLVKTFNLYLPRQSHMVYSFRFLLPSTTSAHNSLQIHIFYWDTEIHFWFLLTSRAMICNIYHVILSIWSTNNSILCYTTKFITLITYLSPNLISISAFNCQILHLPHHILGLAI